MKNVRSTAGIIAFALAGCASTGSGGSGAGGSNAYPTSFSSPGELTVGEFKQNPEKYYKDWLVTRSGNMDSYKKVTLPAYTIEYKTFLQAANQNKLSALVGGGDGAKNVLSMNVSLPWEPHQALFQEITDASYARLKEKLRNMGLEVVEWSDVKAKSEDARAFEKDKLDMAGVKQDDGSVWVSAKGLGRMDSIFWMGSACSASRDNDMTLLMPHYTVSFGYFGGQETPRTLKESHGTASIAFTPQVQIYSGSGLTAAAKYQGGKIVLDKTAVSNEAFASKIVNTADSRSAAKASGENARNLAAATHGTSAHGVSVSTRAGLSYDLQIEPAKFKAIVLGQLDAIEDMIILSYKKELY